MYVRHSFCRNFRPVAAELIFVAILLCCGAARADLVTFDELSRWTGSGPTGSYYNGNSGSGTNTDGWVSGGVSFGNSYDSSFGGFWSGFAYSNINAATTPGYTNQYAANRPTGLGGGGNYALVYGGPEAFWNFPTESVAHSIFVTNTAYTMYSMLDGDPFTKKFGGPTGTDPDFFSIRFEGFSEAGGMGTSTGFVDFFLADYRFSDSSQDYVIRDWTEVNLASLGLVKSVAISFDSSDIGAWGINTPTYAALDNLSFSSVPEPSGLLMALSPFLAWSARSMRNRYVVRRGSV
jgi:hypothetical protein